MKPKSIRYNDRTGYTVEWHDPNSILISTSHANVLLSILRAQVSNEAMQQEFSPDEWQIIRRYEELYCNKVIEEGKKVYQIKDLKKLRAALMDRLIFFYETAVQGPITFQRDYLGWVEPSDAELVNQQISVHLKKPDWKTRYTRRYFEDLIERLGMPSESLLKKLEAQFGVFDPQKGRFKHS